MDVQQSPLVAEAYRYVQDFLASNPTPEEIMAFGPTPEMVERVRLLIAKEKAGEATPAETAELDDYMHIEHLVIMAKTRAFACLDDKQDRKDRV